MFVWKHVELANLASGALTSGSICLSHSVNCPLGGGGREYGGGGEVEMDELYMAV